MAAGGSLLTIAVGYPVAYWMARYLTRYKMLALLLIIVPFWTSFLIRTYALKIILDPQGYLAHGVDGHQQPVQHALHQVRRWRSASSTTTCRCFILPVFASLERMDWTLVEAATDLGASPFKAFRQITLRLTLPGVVTGCAARVHPDVRRVHHPRTSWAAGSSSSSATSSATSSLGAQNWPFGSAMSIALMVRCRSSCVIYIVFATREEQFGA